MRFPNCLVCEDDGVKHPAVSDPRVEAGACLAHAVCKCGWPAYLDSSQTPHEASRPCAVYHRQLRLDALQAQRERGLKEWTIEPMAGNLQVTEPPRKSTEGVE